MENVKILVVDDDMDIRESVQAILEAEDYTAITAADKTEGMDKVKNEKPDLIILDVMMVTWEDGFEMARELKGNPEFKSIPILMLTGAKKATGMDFKSSAGDSDWCPVDGFLDKPVNPEILLAEIAKLLPKKV